MRQVLTTAGHVDHGKSSLVLKLTGTDPDRFEEEKRRGLTIDLGFAWLTLPSGNEIAFVDVPGHERFIHNMLAGVGPVRLVMFVVAADEGWKPQSEEHLAIVDLLGVEGAVVALTKCDLVDAAALDTVAADVRERLRDTALQDAPFLTCSSRTGEGMDRLVAALDVLVSAMPSPADQRRPRLFVDRVFTVRGAGTVVTGTLSGGRLETGQEILVYPKGRRARIRGLQSHEAPIDSAEPVSRVAVNLSGIEPHEVARGDMIGLPGQWRPTKVFETQLTPVRELGHPLTSRGAFKLYAGSAEADATIRLYSDTDEGCFARIKLAAPVTLDVFDHIIIRESGRGETIAGGMVLDISPPARAGVHAPRRLAARAGAAPDRNRLAQLTVAERGAVRTAELATLTGAEVLGEGWAVSAELQARALEAIAGSLAGFHERNPLRQGADLELARAAAVADLTRMRAPTDPELIEQLLTVAQERRVIVRDGATVRLAGYASSAGGPELQDLLATVEAGGVAPPTIAELTSRGTERDLIDAACDSGVLVRISGDLVMSPDTVDAARRALADLPEITVSAFREALGTTRKYAVPLLEYFDARGVTLRRGDVRVLR